MKQMFNIIGWVVLLIGIYNLLYKEVVVAYLVMGLLLLIIGYIMPYKKSSGYISANPKPSCSSNYVACGDEYSRLKELEKRTASLKDFQEKRGKVIGESCQEDHSSAIVMTNEFIKQTNSNYEKGYFLVWIAIFLNLDEKYAQIPPILERAERLLEEELQIKASYDKKQYDKKYSELLSKRDVVDCLLNAYDYHISLLRSIDDYQSVNFKNISQKRDDLIKMMSEKEWFDREEGTWISPPLYSYRRFSRDMITKRTANISSNNIPKKIYKKGIVTLYED